MCVFLGYVNPTGPDALPPGSKLCGSLAVFVYQVMTRREDDGFVLAWNIDEEAITTLFYRGLVLARTWSTAIKLKAYLFRS